MVEDAVINRCGFESEVFKTKQTIEDITPDNICKLSIKNAYPAYLYSFNRDIDVSELRDVQLRPLSKLYVTTNLRNKKGYFDYPHNYGWSWNFPDTYLDTTVRTGYDGVNPNNVNVPFTPYGGTPFIGGDPLVKLKAREIDLKARDNARKEQEGQERLDLDKMRAMMNQENQEAKLQQNEELAGLRAGVSLAKQQMADASKIHDFGRNFKKK